MRSSVRARPERTGSTAALAPSTRAFAAVLALARWCSICCRINPVWCLTVWPSRVSSFRLSLARTLKGVFKAWARFPTWVRARSSTSLAYSRSEFSSSASGSISTGNSPLSFTSSPLRIFCKPLRTSSSGRSPYRTWIKRAIRIPAPITISAPARRPANSSTSASSWVMLPATANETGTSTPGTSTHRSTTRNGWSSGPEVRPLNNVSSGTLFMSSVRLGVSNA